MKINLALNLALNLAMLPAAISVAQAQAATESASAEPVQEVLVTGSRIRRDALTVGPLSTLGSEAIIQAAPTSVGDILQAMPSVGVSLNSNGTQGTSYGVSAINLRYLGGAEGSGNRTLVLVDGHRWVNAVGGRSFRDFVDLNTIPLGIIERIEVLKDGASAIYGADAIAGVVNIHTKRDLEGFEANARVGITDRGDNENYSGYLNWGGDFGGTSILVSTNYSKTLPIRTSDRSLTQRALTPLTAAPPSLRGLYSLPGLANNAYFGTPAGFATSANPITRLPGVTTIGAANAADSSFRTASLPADDFNTMTQGEYSIGPSERAGIFARAAREFGDNLTGRIEALYNYRKSNQLFRPTLLDIRGSNAITIARDQAFNPFGTANGVPLADALAFSGNAFRIQRYAPEIGMLESAQQVRTYRVAAGLEGTFTLAGEWHWDAFLSHSRNEASFTSYAGINYENVRTALASPAVCAATPGCVPLNVFGTITPEAAAFLRANTTDENGARQYDFTANASRELFELPGGTVGFAAGYEYRRESAYDLPDPLTSVESTVLPPVSGSTQTPLGGTPRNSTRGSYDLHEIYSELSLPLLKDLPAIYRLELDAAVRYSQYSTVGGKATAKAGLSWRPVADVLVRGTYSEGFRAPSILELYQGPRGQNFPAVDPCNAGGAGLPGCAGVPATYNQSQFNGGLIAGVTAGNEDLEPETADTYSVGLGFTPSFLPDFSFTVDWFEIEVQGAIASQSATQTLSACASTLTFCDLVQREATGEVSRLVQAVVNLNRIEVAGVDATASYAFSTGIGDFETSLDASYLDKYRTLIPQPNGSVVVDDRAGKSDLPRSTYPHWKGQASLRYSLSNFDAGWKARYIGSSRDIPNNAVNGGKVKDIFYHDLQLGYSLGATETRFALGIDNVLDRLPPASAANNPINFDIYTYDVRGRYLYGTVSTKF
jgi:iron complex outermembrane receptor protein